MDVESGFVVSKNTKKETDHLLKAAFRPDTEILQYEPDTQIVLGKCKLESTNGQVTDQVPRIHASRLRSRIDDIHRHRIRRREQRRSTVVHTRLLLIHAIRGSRHPLLGNESLSRWMHGRRSGLGQGVMVTMVLKLLLLLLDPHRLFARSGLGCLHVTSQLRLPLRRIRSTGEVRLGGFIARVELMAHDGHVRAVGEGWCLGWVGCCRCGGDGRGGG